MGGGRLGGFGFGGQGGCERRINRGVGSGLGVFGLGVRVDVNE